MSSEQNIQCGDTVKWLQPQTAAESSERFTVMEVNGDRLKVQFVCEMQIKPTFVYRTADMEKA